MRQILLFLFALLCGACASPERSVYISDSAPSLVKPTRDAMAAWNHGLKQACPDVRLTHAINRDTADIVVHWGIVNGYETCDGVERAGMIRINPNEIRPGDYDRLRMTIGHELGHALGAEHSKNTVDLMHPGSFDTGRPYEPTWDDITSVCNVWEGGRLARPDGDT